MIILVVWFVFTCFGFDWMGTPLGEACTPLRTIVSPLPLPPSTPFSTTAMAFTHLLVWALKTLTFLTLGGEEDNSRLLALVCQPCLCALT